MQRKTSEIKPVVRYSEAFKMQVVREPEAGGINVDQIRRKYGIGGCQTIHRWVSRHGNGRIIRVEKTEERSGQAQLKRQVRALEQALADANIELALGRKYMRLACERAGIEDVGEFKKSGWAAGHAAVEQDAN